MQTIWPRPTRTPRGASYEILGYIGIMEKKMETTGIIWGYIGILGYIYRVYWDNGK